MAAKVKDAEVTALAEAMLRQLEILRHRGDGASPPKLRQLATLTGDSPTDEQIQKAAGKKLFTEKAVIVEKVAREAFTRFTCLFQGRSAHETAGIEAACKGQGRGSRCPR